ncbi:MAG: hypothetical protein A2W00_09640 [Candidatus Eisenbacteria bacterium RBG_16_71_46]|nr:MAG: hypothetical protein A2W00_09640 [Candidatus Eisenbacteria bacterium RBG_16_71_46]OGF22769.1 MAG: hypothetical protein A2V63_06320 [Candidatus Eisenbacteria bacterium RBG_19FT_COMBO_70_11]
MKAHEELHMRSIARTVVLFTAALTSFAAGTGAAIAATLPITWLSMAPTPFGTSVPNNSVFNLPGVGNVTVTYSIPGTFTDSRLQNACLQNGSLVLGPDTYTWTSHELFATVLNTGPDPLVPVQWTITYTFPSTLPAGSVFVGIAGLGATTSFGGGTSTATVNQNGTFLGDWSGGCGPWGPTQFTGGVGTFQMQNSLTGAGGADPWWNTPLGVVRINDAVSSVTLIFNQLRGDGVGGNIGYVRYDPTPATTPTWGRLKSIYR